MQSRNIFNKDSDSRRWSTWEQRKLNELYKVAGSGGTPSSTKKEYYDGDIPFLGISDMNDRIITATAKSITDLGLSHSAAWLVPKGSISLAMYASVGKIGILGQDTATSQAFFNMVFDDEYLRDFIYTRLEKAEKTHEWESLIATGTQRNLNAERVKNFSVKTPKKEEIRFIARVFNLCDCLITLHQRLLFCCCHLVRYN